MTCSNFGLSTRVFLPSTTYTFPYCIILIFNHNATWLLGCTTGVYLEGQPSDSARSALLSGASSSSSSSSLSSCPSFVLSLCSKLVASNFLRSLNGFSRRPPFAMTAAAGIKPSGFKYKRSLPAYESTDRTQASNLETQQGYIRIWVRLSILWEKLTARLDSRSVAYYHKYVFVWIHL